MLRTSASSDAMNTWGCTASGAWVHAVVLRIPRPIVGSGDNRETGEAAGRRAAFRLAEHTDEARAVPSEFRWFARPNDLVAARGASGRRADSVRTVSAPAHCKLGSGSW